MKSKKHIIINIDESLCKGCNICKEFCNEGIFVTSTKINSLGYYVPIPENLDKCNGCMVCEHICPELAVILEKSELIGEISHE